MKKNIALQLSLIASFIPAISFAAGITLKDILGVIAEYLDIGLKLLMGLAVLYFVWSIIKYFISPGSSENRKEAGTYVLYSVIGFFVIISMWGIVNVLSSTFNLGAKTPPWSSMSNLFPQ